MKMKKLLSVCMLSLCLINTSFAKEMLSDATIDSAVKNKISSDQSLHGATIKVHTSKGVVNLSGNVDSNSQANTATELAQSIAGVSDVNSSDLTIKGSEHPLDDATITAKVKGMFIQQKLFGDKDVAAMTISVETIDGIVSLSGTADNQEQIDNALKIAKSVKGVKTVNSTVKIFP